MKKWNGDRLDAYWRSWQRSRRMELATSDMPAQRASDLATREALARRRIARLVGRSAAVEAQLIIVEGEGGAPRFFLRGNMDDVPLGNRQRVREVTEQTVISAASGGPRNAPSD